MKPSFVVLVDLSATAEQAARYAGVLGAPLHVQLELVNAYQMPLAYTGVGFAPGPYFPRLQTNTDEAFEALAERVPVAAEATVLAAPLSDAVQEAIARFDPLLLAMGLSPEQGLVDYLLRNHALPVLRATHRPLLLVPEAGPLPGLPRRVLIAVDGEPFALSAAALALAPLLASWPAAYSVVHLAAGPTQPRRFALVDVQLSGLLAPSAPLELFDAPYAADPAAGVLRAVAEAAADLLILIARPRSFWGRLFHRSVTAQVLRSCPVPVLLLPAAAPDVPD